MRLIFALLLVFGPALGSSGGPPDRKTGAPGEGTCADCHSFTASGDSTALAGLPSGSYEPGATYNLVLSARYAGQTRWGFQLTCLDTAGNAAGQLIVTDSARTIYSTTGNRQYIKQSSGVTHRGQTSGAWEFGWQAPLPAVGPVIFYWSANACNNDGSTSGDYALPDSLVLSPAGIGEQPAPARYGWYYLNPARHRVVIDYHGVEAQPVRIYSATGELVTTVTPESSGEGLRAVWNGTDYAGRSVPEASYFVRLGEEISTVVKVQLIR